MEIDVTVNTNPLNIQVTDIPNLFINVETKGIQGIPGPVGPVGTISGSGLFAFLNTPNIFLSGNTFNSGITTSSIINSGQFTSDNGNISTNGNGILSSSGLIISGQSVTTGGPYYLNSNPSGFITTGQTGNFGVSSIDLKTILSSGIITQYIPYGEILLSLPISIICTFQNDSDNFDYGYSIYSVSTSGFMTSFSDYLDNTGYILNSKVTL